MSIELIDPLKDQRWMEYISSNEQANVFHHPAWLRVLNRQYNFSPLAFCSLQNNTISSALLFIVTKGIFGGRNAIALPFSDCCKFLSRQEDNEEFFRLFLVYLKESGTGSLEIRDNVTVDSLQSELVGYLHIVDLEKDIDSIFNTFKVTQVQQPIRKSMKDGVIYTVGQDIASLEAYYRLHIITRKKLGTPVQPKGFFLKLWEELIATNMGFIILAQKDGVALSSGVFAGFNSTITYKYSASLPATLKLRPNNLMLWGAIQEAKQRGYKMFDLGRTDCGNEGLRKFKLGWGSTEIPLHYNYYPSVPQPGIFNTVNKKIVNPLIRKSPPFVCRLIGELAYKYFPSL